MTLDCFDRLLVAQLLVRLEEAWDHREDVINVVLLLSDFSWRGGISQNRLQAIQDDGQDGSGEAGAIKRRNERQLRLSDSRRAHFLTSRPK